MISRCEQSFGTPQDAGAHWNEHVLHDADARGKRQMLTGRRRVQL